MMVQIVTYWNSLQAKPKSDEFVDNEDKNDDYNIRIDTNSLDDALLTQNSNQGLISDFKGI